MKILITTDWYEPVINGVVTSVLNLKKEMEQRGHEVKVLTLSQTGEERKMGNVYYVKSIDFGKIYPNARGAFPVRNGFVKELISWKPDVVHSQCEFMTFPYAVKISRMSGCPLLHTYHTIYEDYMHYLPGRIGRYTAGSRAGKKAAACFSRKVLKKTDRVIVPTGKVRDILNSYGIEKPVSVIPSGIDLKRFKETICEEEKNRRKVELGIPKEDRVLVSVGRLASEKNLEEILLYFSKLLKEGEKNLTLLIAGDGPDRENLERETKNLGIQEHVRFTGMIPPEKVGFYYQMGDVFVCASNSETQGITYIEALANGVPALCRKDACLDNVIIDGYNGFQYESYDYFKMHLEYFLENETRRKEMGRMARKTAEEFSVWNFGSQIEHIYKECLDERVPLTLPGTENRQTAPGRWTRHLYHEVMILSGRQ